MSTAQFPTLVWKFRQRHLAVLVEDPGLVAAGETEKEAMLNLRGQLAERQNEDLAPSQSTLSEAELLRLEVKVRPEFEEEGRLHPYPLELPVPVVAVAARHRSGLGLCSLPLLNLQFFFQEKRSLRKLIRHYVRERLTHLTPRQLRAYLPPDELWLSFLRGKNTATASGPRLARAGQLEAVADPLDSPEYRRQLGPAYGRRLLQESLVTALTQRQSNVLLVAPPGAGKTTLAAAVARKIGRSRGGRPRFHYTGAARIIAGMRYLGQWEERCERLVEELAACDGWLCLDNLLALVTVGSSGADYSLAAFFRPYLERGELRVVAESTPAQLEVCRRLMPGLTEFFEIHPLPELRRLEALDVLHQMADSARVSVPPETLNAIYELHQRFLPYRAFPGPSAEFFRTLLAKESPPDLPGVVNEFSRLTGLQEVFLRDDLTLEPAEVFETFQAQVVGQPAACRRVTSTVLTFKAGLNDPERPLGVLLFTGPTGVGKTEMAKALARFFFGDEQRLLRLDMAEYSGPGAAERLLGSSHKPGPLVRQLRTQPFSVVLFDEIEKAAPEVFDLLLSLFDQGRLLDGLGRVTTFRSALLLMTSNLGTPRPALGLTPERGAPPPEHEVKAFFRPEFFNRIDAVIPFDPLEPATVRHIAELELARLDAREGLASRGLRLSYTPALLDFLAHQGYDRRYGARPLQRLVEEAVVTPLARFLVTHPGLRASTLRLDFDGREVTISL